MSTSDTTRYAIHSPAGEPLPWTRAWTESKAWQRFLGNGHTNRVALFRRLALDAGFKALPVVVRPPRSVPCQGGFALQEVWR